jgi:hypothetical protein
MVRCGQCSSPVTGSWSTRRSRRYPYYRCPRKGCGGSNVCKEHLEGLFVHQLVDVSLRPEAPAMLSAVLEDAWKERVRTSGAAQTSLAARLRELEQKRNRLVDAYLDGRGIGQPTFERQTKRFDDDEAEVQRRLDVLSPAEMDLTRAIAFTHSMLLDLPGCWTRLDPQHRSQFVSALHPTGLVYEDGSIGTAQTSWWMASSLPATRGTVDLAARTGFEPLPPP